MRQTEFQIGDRCLFSFSSVENLPVEVVGDYEPNEECVWVAPDDQEFRLSLAYSKTIGGRYTIASNICYLKLVERPMEKEDPDVDISTLI